MHTLYHQIKGGHAVNEGGQQGGATRMRTHCVHIDARQTMSVTGVKDVGSFNEREVILLTEVGGLTIDGAGLHITKLNLEDGQVLIEGEIAAMEYDEIQPQERGSFFSSVFR